MKLIKLLFFLLYMHNGVNLIAGMISILLKNKACIAIRFWHLSLDFNECPAMEAMKVDWKV